MPYCKTLSRRRFILSVAAIAMCSTLIGCGPYYTMEGSMGTKKIIIHDGDKKIKIDIGTDLGGGLQQDPSAIDMQTNKFRIEGPEDSVVEGTVIGPKVGVTNVTYKGKKLMLNDL